MTVNELTKEWVEIILSRPSETNTFEKQLRTADFAKAELYKINSELESRQNEAEELKLQVHALSMESSSRHALENLRVNQLCTEEVPRDSPSPIKIVDLSEEHNTMERPRNFLKDGESLLKKLQELKEMSELRTQIYQIRSESSEQCLADFNALVDLALTLDNLTAELTAEKKRKSSPKTPAALVCPIVEATQTLAATVSSLQAEVFERERVYGEESSKLVAALNRRKSKQRNAKFKFQQEMNSVFADFKFLTERIGRAESSLEKLNVHYKLSEEEMLAIVAPLIDEIDGAKEIVAALDSDARRILLREI